ncbi:hypothetical protein DPEC_G00074010 [Dallia pectoralis]|uniref:Uncharacterized protein n=1 Tax=Dallia pectoralis TaxID=75939 RepID=A0ACC2H328_DALPE|nr:hypothetical protein DPEC_G00074010 [Dallia pectoralis]
MVPKSNRSPQSAVPRSVNKRSEEERLSIMRSSTGSQAAFWPFYISFSFLLLHPSTVCPRMEHKQLVDTGLLDYVLSRSNQTAAVRGKRRVPSYREGRRGSASSTTSMTGSGLASQSPPLRQNQSPARSLPSPVTPPMPLQLNPLTSQAAVAAAAAMGSMAGSQVFGNALSNLQAGVTGQLVTNAQGQMMGGTPNAVNLAAGSSVIPGETTTSLGCRAHPSPLLDFDKGHSPPGRQCCN